MRCTYTFTTRKWNSSYQNWMTTFFELTREDPEDLILMIFYSRAIASQDILLLCITFGNKWNYGVFHDSYYEPGRSR